MATFRRLQIALGLIWLFDGLLQLQPTNLSPSFAQGVRATAMGQPARVQGLIVAIASILAAHPLVDGLGIGAIQVTLGVAILCPRTRRLGLWCSIPWALGVWALGEGFGGLWTGFAMLPSGAPGAALLYALAATVLLPRCGETARDVTVDSPVSHGLLGDCGAASVWGLLWLGAAVLQVIPVITLSFKLTANLQMTSLGEQGWLASIDHVAGRVASNHGVALSVALTTFELTVASAALVNAKWRARLLVVALSVLPLFWVVGENFGGLLSGSATDVGAMPLYVLLALGLMPRRPARAMRSHAVDPSSWPSMAPRLPSHRRVARVPRRA